MTHYYALTASLPMPKPDEDFGITPEAFMESCSTWITGSKLEELEKLSLDPVPEDYEEGSLAERYARWESSLRSAIALKRAERTGKSAEDLPETEYVPDAVQTAAAAFAASNPMEREKILDHGRWTKLEELEQGQLFTFDALCAYKLKLLIRTKWNKRVPGAADKNLDAAAQKISASVQENHQGE